VFSVTPCRLLATRLSITAAGGPYIIRHSLSCRQVPVGATQAAIAHMRRSPAARQMRPIRR